MILAIESSSSVCSVSLQTDSGNIIDRWTEGRAEHSKKLVPFIGELLEESSGSVEQGLGSLQKVILSNGPGSYTGLRIAGSALRGLLFNRKVEFWAASTLASIACSVLQEQEKWPVSGLVEASSQAKATAPSAGAIIHSVIDARGGYSYYQPFAVEESDIRILAEPKRVANSTVIKALHSHDQSFLAGVGWLNFTQAPTSLIQVEMEEKKQFFHARNLLTLFRLPSRIGLEITVVDRLEPYYLGNNQVNNTYIPTSKET